MFCNLDFIPYSALFPDNGRQAVALPANPQVLGKPIKGLNFFMSHFSTTSKNNNSKIRNADDNDDDADDDADSDDKENAGSERSFYKASSSAAERLREENRRLIEQQFVVPSAPPEQDRVDVNNLQRSEAGQQKNVRRKKLLQLSASSVSSASDDASINDTTTDEDFEVIDALDETSADLQYPRLSSFGDYDALLARQSPTPPKTPVQGQNSQLTTSDGSGLVASAPSSSPRPNQWLWG